MAKKRNVVARMAYDLTGYARQAGAKVAGLFDPFKRQKSGSGLLQNYGNLGNTGISSRIDPFGFQGFLKDIGQFNPLYVEPFIQVLMRRAAMPRLALIILTAALKERQYVVEGGTPEDEAFHQAWVDQLMPQLLAKASNAVWFGWQPYVLDWKQTRDGDTVPYKAKDVDPFSTEALEDPVTKEFVGLMTEGQNFGPLRSFKLTWEGYLNNHYGEGQCLTVYPYWWAHSLLLVLTMRYYERSVDPVRVAMAQNQSMPTGEVDGNGNPIFVDLTEIVAEALDVLAGGDSVAMPLGPDGEKTVDLKTLDFPDRSDTWLKILAYMEQKQLTGTLSMPGMGVGSQVGEVSGGDARVTEKLQSRVLEYVTDMPIDAINDVLLPRIHELNNRKGPCPRLEGKAFKREQSEQLFELFKAALPEVLPEIGEDGEPTGENYRPIDLLKFDKIAKALDLPAHSINEVARMVAEVEQASGAVGRPSDPLGPAESVNGTETRAESRAKGLDR